MAYRSGQRHEYGSTAGIMRSDVSSAFNSLQHCVGSFAQVSLDELVNMHKDVIVLICIGLCPVSFFHRLP